MSEPFDVPAAFRDVLAGLEEQRYVSGPGHAFYECFGCGPGHPDGLGVRCFKSAEGVISPIVIPARYQGPKGSTIRYLAGAPLETPLLGHGRVVNDHGRYVDVEGRLDILETGRTVATARGRFFPIDGEHGS